MILMRRHSVAIFAIILTTIQTFSFGQDTVTRNAEIQIDVTDDDFATQSLNQTKTPTVSFVPQSSPPSITPTNRASNNPSFLPTSAPTPECHDLASYRSPINDFKCRDHRNTDCTKWKYLGLTEYQVLDLLRSCPVSCRVDCGHSFEPSPSPTILSSASPSYSSILIPFEIEMFILNRTVYLLKDEIEEFENATSIYLASRINTDSIQLVSFEISSQTFFNDRRLLRGVSSLVDQRVLKVLVTVIMRVLKEDADFTNTTVLQQMVISSLDSDDFRIYVQEIETLSDFEVVLALENTIVSPELIKEPKTEEEEKIPNKRSTSAAAPIVSSIVAVTMVCVLAFYLHREKRLSGLHRWIASIVKSAPADSSDEMNHRSEDRDGESICSEGPGKIDGVCVSKVLSQNSSDEKSFHLDVKVDSSDGDQSVVGGGSDGETTVKNRSPKTNSRSLHLLNHNHNKNTSKGYSKHIPTMIVIDNIDDDEAASPQNMENVPNLFGKSPAQDGRSLYVKRIEATSDIVAALSGRKDTNPIQAYNLLHPLRNDDNARFLNEEISPHTGTSSRLSIGDTISLSSPYADIEGDIKAQDKKVFTFNSSQKDDFTVLFEKKMKQDEEKSVQKISLRGFFKRKKKPILGDESVHSEVSHYESDAEVSEVSEAVRAKDRSEESNLQKKILDDMLLHNDNSLGHRDDNESAEIDYDPNEMLGDLPTDNTSHRHSKSSSATSFTFSHKRTASEFSLSAGYSYSFLAPKTGKLGIIIQSNGLMPPTIFQVKDYSPLFGQVEPGDKIVSVDGQDTSKMSTTEITQLLAAKRAENSDKTSRIKITVVSRYQKEGIQVAADSAIPENIGIVDTVVEVRDETEASQSIEKKRREDCSNASYSSDGELSCHLLGNVNSDDWDEADNMEDYITQKCNDQFL